MSDTPYNLNAEQLAAASHNHGPLLILAGAGSGKTSVLVARTKRLLEESIVVPKKLCVLTFTNKAARELKRRVADRLGSGGDKIFAGTFHSFGLQVLREQYRTLSLPKHFSVVDQKDSAAIVKELLRNLRQHGKSTYDPDIILRRISNWREKGQTKAIKDDPYDIATEWLLPKYLNRLLSLGAVDFDGLLLHPIALMEKSDAQKEILQSRYDQIMVDEFQDTNFTQMKLLNLLSEKHRNLSVVGDDDQSIYGWRGAKVSNILNFPKRYPEAKVVRLEQNYRSQPGILKLANHIISANTERHKKVLRPARSSVETKRPELFVYENPNEEAECVCTEIQSLTSQGGRPEDIAVLYRSNSQGALIEAELRSRQIPYQISGGTAFFDRKETRDALAYLRAATRPTDHALRRIINTPSRGIGDQTIEKINQHAESARLTFYKAAKAWRSAGIEPNTGAHLECFFNELAEFRAGLAENAKVPSVAIMGFLQKIGYKSYLEKTSKDAVVATRRWQFLQIFAEVLDSFTAKSSETGIADFIQAMELRDQPDDDNRGKVHLLTLHACKGLEFPTVFLVGVEEDILPHRTLGTDIAEERRLFYVGITRAEERLILSRTRFRNRYGKTVPVVASRFITDLPAELIQSFDGPKKMDEQKRKDMVAALFSKLDSLDGASEKTS